MTEREKERMIEDLKKMEIDFECIFDMTETIKGYSIAINHVVNYIESIEVEETEND